jgi:hypothetical protein
LGGKEESDEVENKRKTFYLSEDNEVLGVNFSVNMIA